MEILLKYFYKKNELFRKSDVGLGFCASNPTKPWFSSIYSYSICSPKPEGKCNIPTSGCRVPPKEPPVILPPCVPDETVKDRFCIVHTPDDQGVFVFADNSFFSGLWQRDSLPGSCSAVCHWMHEAPQVTLHPRRGNPPLLCSSHQGLQNSRQSFSVSEKSEFEFTFLYDTWFSLSSSWFKIIPIRRSYATTIIWQAAATDHPITDR